MHAICPAHHTPSLIYLYLVILETRRDKLKERRADVASNFALFIGYEGERGNAVRCSIMLRISRKVAVSILSEVIGIFSWSNFQRHNMAMRSTLPLSEMSTKNLPGGVKCVQGLRITTSPPSMCRLSRKCRSFDASQIVIKKISAQRKVLHPLSNSSSNLNSQNSNNIN
jgi:hypothetical protein